MIGKTPSYHPTEM